ncbi:hypothetical protein Pcinc_014996 [Petrolisthes cinctipes]|uniref:Ninjurin-1 n=1 Tax=Petrolisthes cinctipes TaxID=88211 RepID=A0AAE1FVT2_PETCI|nr:hypothetical protein Pcinc_014996 [Petrolisthes cinctipes]
MAFIFRFPSAVGGVGVWMPRELRRRRTMEMSSVTNNLATTDAEDTNLRNGSRFREDDVGVDDGFGPFPPTSPEPAPPTNGEPRHSPFPPSPSPVPRRPGHGGYIPVPPGDIGAGKKPLDFNLYATKKTVAQGMMDIALLTANANQLRYVLEVGKFGQLTARYYISLTLISLSIIMQLVIGVVLIILGRYKVSDKEHAKKADVLNNWVVLFVFVITVVNVFISSFAIEPMEGVDPILLRSVMAGGAATERIEGN